MIAIALSWILLAAVYLALVGGLGFEEGAAAVLCGGLGALWVHQIRRRGDRALRLRFSATAPMVAALTKLPGQTMRVGVRLWKAAFGGDVSGQDRAVAPHEIANCPSKVDDPVSAGARAIAVLAASLSPDAYVLRLEPERGRILVHAFLPQRDEQHAR